MTKWLRGVERGALNPGSGGGWSDRVTSPPLSRGVRGGGESELEYEHDPPLHAPLFTMARSWGERGDAEGGAGRHIEGYIGGREMGCARGTLGGEHKGLCVGGEVS